MNLEMVRARPDAEDEFERFDCGTLEALAFQNLTISRDHENLDRYARRYHKSIDMLLKLRGLRSFTDPVRNIGLHRFRARSPGGRTYFCRARRSCPFAPSHLPCSSGSRRSGSCASAWYRYFSPHSRRAGYLGQSVI